MFSLFERLTQYFELALERSLQHFIANEALEVPARTEALNSTARSQGVKQPPLRFVVQRWVGELLPPRGESKDYESISLSASRRVSQTSVPALRQSRGNGQHRCPDFDRRSER